MSEHHDHEIALAQVERIRATMPDADRMTALAELFRILGDDTRIRILYALRDQELCVTELERVVGMSQSAVSHQLRLLRQARLVRTRRDGKSICYSLDDEHVHILFEQGLLHIMED